MGAANADSTQRVQSNRVYAIIFGVFLLVCTAVLVAVWFRATMEEEPEVVTKVETAKVEAKPVQKPKEDTGIAEPVPEKPKSAKTKTSKPPSGETSSTAAKPAPAPKGGGPLSVTMADPTQATGIEVVCPSGLRKRASFSGGRATISDVPQEACTLYFKGGPPAQYKPIGGHRSVTCRIVGTTGSCG
jgi:hypothetical protein